MVSVAKKEFMSRPGAGAGQGNSVEAISRTGTNHVARSITKITQKLDSLPLGDRADLAGSRAVFLSVL